MRIRLSASRLSAACLGIIGMLLGWPATAQPLQSPAPAIEWQRCFGAASDDFLFSIVATNDGGYIACGYTLSNTLPRYHALEDAYVVKIDSQGDLEWQKCYGGSKNEEGYQIIQTLDGGYAVLMTCESSDGDITSNNGSRDACVLKLDDTGKVEWAKDFGGSDWDEGDALIQNGDSSIVFCGSNRGIASEDVPHHGGSENDDGWIVRLNAPNTVGNFQRYIGGSRLDRFFSIIPGKNGGFVVAGLTNSFDGDASGLPSIDTFYNVWLCDLDANGTIVWQKQYGGSATDWANCVASTADGGLIVAGATNSSDGDVSGYHGGYDGWVFKVDAAGALQWQRALGGSMRDGIRWITTDRDGGYTAIGTTSSSDGDVTQNYGQYDGWLVKLSSSGDILWQKCFGGSDVDILYGGVPTADGGLIVVGKTVSQDGDVLGGHGAYDGWIIKLRPTSNSEVREPLAHGLGLKVATGENDHMMFATWKAMDASAATLTMTNALGQVANCWSSNGTNSVSCPISNLPSGVYYVTLHVSGQIQTQPLLIVR